MRVPLILWLPAAVLTWGAGASGAAERAGPDMIDVNFAKWKNIEPLLEEIRARHGVPALAASTIYDGSIINYAAVGVRKLGTDVKVTAWDKFHIGSCTKAMTATLLAILIEQGKLKWSSTLAEVFPELLQEMHPGYRNVTLLHLLAHRGGVPNETWPTGMSFLDVHRLPGPPRRQRWEFVRRKLKGPPEAPPGERYIYSNAGYAILGVACEKAADAAWEDLLREHIFGPLGMGSAGFGAMGTPGKVDQPWQHRVENGKAIPMAPGPLIDNPPAIAPAGTVHCTIGDWAKFVQVHLRGARDQTTLLGIANWTRLHTPAFGGTYAGGWGTAHRGWGGGRVYTHAGSNNMNYAVVWMAPHRNFAVVVATNQAGKVAPKACDDAAAAIIRKYLTEEKDQ
jgi:CubicO group peptidase (beta-lactamase class C family)